MPKTATAIETMVLTAQRSDLLKMLSGASRVCGNGKPIPVLGSVYIAAGTGETSWWSTDTELWRGGTLKANVKSAGEGLLPVAHAMQIMKALPDGPVSLTFSESAVHVVAGAFKARIPVMGVQDFPPPPAAPFGGTELPCAVLAQMIEQVQSCILETISQFYLRGAWVSLSPEAITIVGLDGHQLAKSTVTHESKDLPTTETILPKRTLSELGAILSDADTDHVTYLSVDDKHVFRVGDEVLISRELDGQYPQWPRMFPSEHRTRVICDRELFLSALRRVSLAVDAQSMRMTFAIADGAMALSAASAERGENADRVEIEQDGPAVTFSANPTYIKNFLDTATSAKVRLDIKDDSSVLLFAPVGQTGPDYVHLVMVMR